jgi:hypothetical protein
VPHTAGNSHRRHRTGGSRSAAGNVEGFRLLWNPKVHYSKKVKLSLYLTKHALRHEGV